MSTSPLTYHWTVDEFVRASQAGAFNHRVELVEGEVWPVVIGSWHGDTLLQVAAMLRAPGVRVSAATLPTADSLPDPDCWVRRADAEPAGEVSPRVQIWDPADVLLVVEVSDETMLADLGIKAKLYGRAGYAVYWVVTPDAIYEHTQPTRHGYEVRREYRSGSEISLEYAHRVIAVGQLIDTTD
jgi:hypothetical protein